MAEVRCPMCGKPNPPDIEICQHCEARLVPLAPGSSPDETSSGGVSSEEPVSPGEGWLDDLRGGEEEADISPSEGEPPVEDSDDWLGRLDSEDPLWASESKDIESKEAPPAFLSSEPDDQDTQDIPGMAFKENAEPVKEEDSADWLKSIEPEAPEGTETQEIPGMAFKESEGPAKEDLSDWPSEPEPSSDDPVEDFSTIEIPGLAMKSPPDDADSAADSKDTPVTPPLEESAAEPGELPEWLAEDVPPAEPGELPEWLSGEAPAEDRPILPVSDVPDEVEDLPAAVPGELPDWLSEEVPAEAPDESPLVSETAEPADVPEAEPGGLPDWLSDTAPEAAAAMAAAVEPGSEAEAPDIEPGELPDWLSDKAPVDEQPTLPPAEEIVQPADEPEAEPGEAPDWLSDTAPEAAAAAAMAAAVEPASEAEAPDIEPGELPDWLSDKAPVDEQPTLPPAEEIVQPADEPEAEPGEAPDWLSDTAPEAAAAAAMAAAVEPGSEAEAPDIEPGELPDWLSDKAPVDEQPTQPPAEEIVQPVDEPEAEPGEAPDWLSDAAPEAAAAAAMAAAVEPGSEAETPDIEPGELPDWLSDKAPVDEPPTLLPAEDTVQPADEPEAEPGDLPDWLSDEGEATDSEKPPDWITEEAAAVTAGAAVVDEPEAEELSKPAAVSEEQAVETTAEGEEGEDGEMPDWLKAGAAATAAGVVVGALRDDDEESKTPAASEDPEELPDWLQGEVEADSWEVEEAPAREQETQPPIAAGEAPVEDIEPVIAASRGEQADDWAAGGEPPDEADLPLSLEEEDVPDWLKSLKATQQEAAEGATVEDIEGLEPTVEDPAEMVEEGEVPDWLEELSFAVPAVAVEATGGQEIPGAESPPAEGDDEPLTPQDPDAAPILPGVLQDAFDDSEEMDIPPAEGVEDEDLEPADLPGWLKAMRPVEAVAAVSPFIEEGDPGQVIEGVGPLAGLQGVLPAEPDITQGGSSSMVSTRVDVTKNQYDHVGLLKTIVQEEAEPQEFGDKRSLIQPGHILRWIIAVALIAILALPLVTGGGGVTQPTNVPDETLAANQVIASQGSGNKVLVAFDYQPGLSGEMDAIADSVFQDLLSRQVLLTIVSTSTTGPALAEEFLGEGGPAGDFGYTHGEDYLNLGYIPGGAAGLQFFALNPQQTLEIPFNLTGLPDSYSAWSMPPLSGISKLSDYSMVLVLTDDAGVARAWVEQVGIHLDASPLVMVASGQAAPLVRPYYETNPRQVDGLVSGLVGGISYEQHTGNGMLAGTYWDAYNNGIIIAIVLIIVGGLYGTVAALIRRSRGGSEPKVDTDVPEAEEPAAEPEEES